jgi:hypothetical protein
MHALDVVSHLTDASRAGIDRTRIPLFCRAFTALN